MQVTVTLEQQLAREEYIDSLTVGRRMFRLSELKKMTPTFQRPLSRQQVNLIVKEWRTWRFDDPVVCICSDGTMLLDDGQHRVAAAAKKLGEDAEVLCRLAYTDLPGEEFVALNSSRRAVDAYWKHEARLSDGSEVAMGVSNLVKKHGFVITRSSSNPHAINAIHGLTMLYQTDADALDRTLNVLAAVIKARENELGWLKISVIQGIWYVIRNYDCVDATMIRGLKRTVPSRVGQHNSSDSSRNAGDVIIAYNHQQPHNKRLNLMMPK